MESTANRQKDKESDKASVINETGNIHHPAREIVVMANHGKILKTFPAPPPAFLPRSITQTIRKAANVKTAAMNLFSVSEEMNEPKGGAASRPEKMPKQPSGQHAPRRNGLAAGKDEDQIAGRGKEHYGEKCKRCEKLAQR